MCSQALISIIVPVYKCEAYLSRCITSITQQTYHNIEIILVDDGSPDKSGDICDEFASKDERIEAIHKQHGGVSSARNAGLDASSGEYIMFVDSDDMINNYLCEHMLNSMDDTCDFVVSSFYRSKSFDLKYEFQKECNSSMQWELLSFDTIDSAFQELFDRKILNCPYAKLFKRKIIGDLRYDQSISLGEDLLFNLEYFRRINGTIKVSSYSGYMYFVGNSNSITSNFKENNFEVAVYLHKKMREFAQDYHMDEHITKKIDKVLVLDTIGYLHELYFSGRSRTDMHQLAMTCLCNSELQNCYHQTLDLKGTHRVLLFFMKKRKEGILHFVFTVKNMLKSALK